MYFTRIDLHGFRNYRDENWRPAPALNLIHGDNGQGKTNLLEAVQLLLIGRSFRARRERELIAFSLTVCRLEGELAMGERHLHLSFLLAEGKKEHLFNQLPMVQMPDLVEKPGIVLFSPADLRLVQGSPVHRRRYLDQLLLQVHPGYKENLSRYWKGLSQRNALLREIRARRASLALLSAWDEDLAAAGEQIARARKGAAAELAPRLRDVSANMTDKRVDLEYRSGSCPPGQEEKPLREVWATALAEDLARGITSRGPHRADLLFQLDGQDAFTYGSQGQQRTLALGLRLAETAWLEKKLNHRPILLLDDVFSELDPQRRGRLVTLLHGEGQVILTCTDLEQLPRPLRTLGKTFRVRNGKLAVGEG